METEDGHTVVLKGIQAEESSDEDTGSAQQTPLLKRECPVPKPGGLVGEILGFKHSSSNGNGAKPP